MEHAQPEEPLNVHVSTQLHSKARQADKYEHIKHAHREATHALASMRCANISRHDMLLQLDLIVLTLGEE